MSVQEYVGLLNPTLSEAGYTLIETDENTLYRGSGAWAAYYRGADCKLQLCWASRDGGTYFMLAALDAPNELGLVNSSKKWRMMLLLSEVDDIISAPSVGADYVTVSAWLKQLFNMHYASAHAALMNQLNAE